MRHAAHNEITHFSSQKEINHMYAHITIGHIGIALVGIFIPIYFYTIGYTIQQILLFELLYAIWYIALTPVAIEFIKATCINKAFMLSVPFRILFFLLLVYIKEFSILFYILPILLALRFTIFNLAFHFNMIDHSDNKKTGKNFALIHILMSFGSFLAPYLGALVITFLGFDAVIYVTTFILIISIFPLMGVQETCLVGELDHKRVWKGIFDKQQPEIFMTHAGYAIEAQVGKILWPLFLFIFLGNVEKVGLITSISLFVAAIAFYIIGKISDEKGRRKLIRQGTTTYSASWVTRLFGFNPSFIVFSDIFRNIAEKMMIIPWSAYSYEIAKKKRPYEYLASREIAISVVRVFITPILIIVFDFLPITSAFIFSFVLAAVTTLLIGRIARVEV